MWLLELADLLLRKYDLLPTAVSSVASLHIPSSLVLQFDRVRPTVYYACVKTTVDHLLLAGLLLRFLRRFDRHSATVVVRQQQEMAAVGDAGAGRQEIEPLVAGE